MDIVVRPVDSHDLVVTVGADGTVTRARFEPHARQETVPPQAAPTAELLRRAMDRWQAGDPFPFADIPLAPAHTEFARAVRAALLETKLGDLITYSELAQLAGRPRAVRAVASVCSHNPIALLVPCHRVVPKGAADYGTYAYGRELKAALIKHERENGNAFLPPPTPAAG